MVDLKKNIYIALIKANFEQYVKNYNISK